MFEFLKQYLKNPRSVGAIAPSSRMLAENMMKPVDFDRAACIVEYGPGTGVFTEELIRRKRPETALYIIERNNEFYRQIKEKYGELPKVHVIHGSAENTTRYLKKYGETSADYIVSGLPFTSLPKELSDRILADTQKAIGDDGVFVTFQYTRVKEAYFKSFFELTEKIHVKKNLPPAYVMVMRNKR